VAHTPPVGNGIGEPHSFVSAFVLIISI
jgi:hypothetical protein